MENVRRCIVLDLIKMLNGSCNLDKLALLVFMVDKLSGFSLFTWSVENYLPISQDFLDTIENLKDDGYLIIDNGSVKVTKAKLDPSLCGNNWVYDRLVSYASEVINKYGNKDIDELLNEAITYEQI